MALSLKMVSKDKASYGSYRVEKTHRMPEVACHFRKRATDYRALLPKMAFKDKASYGS